MTTPLYSDAQLNDENNPIDFNAQAPVIAHGDSWFAFGSVLPWQTGNMLNTVRFPSATGIVNYAAPMQKLQGMADRHRYPRFVRAMTLRGMPKWQAILLSGGGNDLFEALRASPNIALGQRLLRTRPEWTKSRGASKYLSDAGWRMLLDQLMLAYTQFDEVRHQSTNPDAPIITHVYDYATPRNAPALSGMIGPWLCGPLKLFDIPEEDWVAVVQELLDRFNTFLLTEVSARIANFHVADTSGTLTPAKTTDTGATDHWENEVHPNPAGYEKLAEVFSAKVAKVLALGAPAATGLAAAKAVKASKGNKTGKGQP